jgi:triosephosphate isomerase
MAKKLIVANWKMNGSIAKIEHDLSVYKTNALTNSPNVVFALPMPYLYQTIDLGAGFGVACQDISQFCGFGAYTGEISAAMLLEFNVKYTLVGHSERRAAIGEDNSLLAKKLENLISVGITPILCIGEPRSIRDSGKYQGFLIDQLSLLTSLNVEVLELVIAYEPIWAIGTGKTPTIEEITEIVNLIHSFVQKTSAHAKILVLYGGSVTGKNIADILHIPEIAGVLVGGASLKVDEFTAICTEA